ncbi:hypothetical protein MHYP_G00312870 [Metynnis hypsauchen]
MRNLQEGRCPAEGLIASRTVKARAFNLTSVNILTSRLGVCCSADVQERDAATQIRHFRTLVCFSGDKRAVRLSTRLSDRVLSGARRAACSGSVEEPTPLLFHVSQCFMLSERDRSAIFGHFVGRRVKILTDRSVARSKTAVV